MRGPLLLLVLLLQLGKPLAAKSETSIGKIEHGCYIKTGMDTEASGTRKTVSKKSVAKCARACSIKRFCEGFVFNPTIKGENCDLKQKAIFYETVAVLNFSSRDGGVVRTSLHVGWCPKVANTNIQPANSLRCTDSGQLCTLPIHLNGEVKWDCVRNGDNKPVCNTAEANDDFNDSHVASFSPCGDCSSCDLLGTFFEEFNVINFNLQTLNFSGPSLQDCRILCNLAKGCNVFLYDEENNQCTLKYGLGKRNTENITKKYVIGSKNCYNQAPLISKQVNFRPVSTAFTVEAKSTSKPITHITTTSTTAASKPVSLPASSTIPSNPNVTDIREKKENLPGANIGLITIIMPVVGGVLILVSIASFAWWRHRKMERERRQTFQEEELRSRRRNIKLKTLVQVSMAVKRSPRSVRLPGHIKLEKNDNMKNEGEAISTDIRKLEDEYYRLEDYIDRNFFKETRVGNLARNQPHNRNQDYSK